MSKWDKYALAIQSLGVYQLMPEDKEVVDRVVNGHYDCFSNLANMFKNKDNIRILVAGMGSGHELEALKMHGFSPKNIYGITIIEADIKLSKIYFSDIFNISIGDIHNTKFDSGYFDLIISKHTLEHSISPYLALWEFNRLLKNDGYIFLEIPVEQQDRLSPFTDNYEKDTHIFGFQHICCLYPVQVLNLLLKTGFKLLDYYQAGGGYDYLASKDIMSTDTHYNWMKNYLKST